MQRYLISYEFNDGEDQETGGNMLVEWYESGESRIDQKPMRFVHGCL